MPQPKVFISHSSKTTETKAFRDQVYAALDEHGNGNSFRVFLDNEDICTGDEWHKKILRNLCTCDAVVILLSRAALNSQWVRQEAAFSAIRRYGDLALKLIVVTLDDVSVQDIQDCPYLGGVSRLYDVQFTPEYKTPNQIIDELADLIVVPNSPVGDSLLRMSFTLGYVHSEVLENALGVLESNSVAALSWNTSPAYTLALSVASEQTKGFENLRKVLPELRDIPDREIIADILLEKVKHLWVNPEAAENLAVAQKQKRVPLVINGFNPQNFTSESYADRVWGKGNHIHIAVGGARSYSDIEQVVRDSILYETDASRNKDPIPEHMVEKELREIKKPILLTFPPPEGETSRPTIPDDEVLDALIDKYQTMAILIPIGTPRPNEKPDIPQLLPELNVEEESSQFSSFLEVNRYIMSMKPT